MSTKDVTSDSKSVSKNDKNTTKNRNLEKGRKRACATLSFGVNFDLFLDRNASKNICEKLCRKKLQKTRKLNQKQGTIPSPEMNFLTFLRPKRFLQNSVFTREKQCFLKIQRFEFAHKFEKHPKKKSAKTQLEDVCEKYVKMTPK